MPPRETPPILSATSASGEHALPGDVVASRSAVGDYFELTKPRLSLLSVITAVVGYLAASPDQAWTTLTALLIGTSLAAGGAAALNQWLEREADARMVRTRGRPIPAGRIQPTHALWFGLILSLFGCGLLYVATHPLAAALALITIASYVLLYTPLKRMTPLNTLVGAIPGALPPLIGWAAAEGGIGALGWILFAILFFWQLPHFYAIAWMHREDYDRGGFVMLTKSDAQGDRVARHAFAFSLVMIACSLLPSLTGHASWVYGGCMMVIGLAFVRPALAFLARSDRNQNARRLFLASIIYLPVHLVVLMLDLWLLGG